MRKLLLGLSTLSLPLLVLAPPTLAAARPAASTVVPKGDLYELRDHEAGFDALTRHDDSEQVDTTIEPSIAVNPSNPLNAVIGFQIGRVDAGGDATNGYAVTFDGGKTWKNGVIPGLTRGHGGTLDRASDAVVAFGPDNHVYFSSLVFNDTTDAALESAIVNNTSTDGGKTWGPVTKVQDDLGGGLNDKNWVVVDNSSAPGHHLGRVYVVWDRVAGLIAKYSDDDGKTWVPPSPAFTPNVYAAQGIGSYPVVKPNGDLLVAFMADVAPPALTINPGDELGEAVSGISKVTTATFTAAGTIPTGVPLPLAVPASVHEYTGNPIRNQRAGSLLAAAVDPVSGRTYVVWEDSLFRTDAANDVVLSYSDDGIRWSEPVRVNPGKTNDELDHYNPSVAVHQDGTVDVIWRQRQESASANVNTYSKVITTWIARSHDHGVTFGKPLQVSTAPSNTLFGAFSRGGLFQGDYDQVATAGPLTYVVRSESYPAHPKELAPAVPSAQTVHHQTTWVAVLGTSNGSVVAKPPVTATPPKVTPPTTKPVKHQAGGVLASTGGTPILALLGLLALLAALVVRRRRA